MQASSDMKLKREHWYYMPVNCLSSLAQFYKVTGYVKMDKTSWTYCSIFQVDHII